MWTVDIRHIEVKLKTNEGFKQRPSQWLHYLYIQPKFSFYKAAILGKSWKGVFARLIF